jgi:3-hydroxy-9,10-secoandrosta-1,3,5(10)-triene-9,17-dione monooxygenase
MPDVALAEQVAVPAADAERFTAGIAALLPEIRARATQTERAGGVPDDIIQALTDADAAAPMARPGAGPRKLLPGHGADRLRLRIHRLGGERGRRACLADRPVRRRGSARGLGRRCGRARVVVPGTHRLGRRVDGGFHLSGRWHFSSGVDHCGWALLGGVVPDQGDGAEFRTFLVPRRDFTIDHDSWHVTGLAGTGSKDLVVQGAFVPAHRTHSIIDVHHGRDPGFAVNDRPFFRLPWRLVFGYTIAAPAIGAALGAVDAFIENNRSRVSAYGGPPVARDPAVNRPLARALIATDTARVRLCATWTELRAMLAAGQTIPYERRVQALYEAALAHHSCTDAIHDLVAVNGGRTMQAAGALQRFFRDLLAMRNHPAANLEFTGTLYAQAKLGVEPPPFVPSQRFVL